MKSFSLDDVHELVDDFEDEIRGTPTLCSNMALILDDWDKDMLMFIIGLGIKEIEKDPNIIEKFNKGQA